MNVLVYFEGVQQRTAQRTVALLADKFVFNLDILANALSANRDVAALEGWSRIARGKVTVLRMEGEFEQAVARACGAKRYDLVVAAPNDRRGLLRVILGSRIGRLVGVAPATIWVPRGEKVRLQRIVVGVSGGPQSEQDARLAARLALAYDARLELVYVVSQLPLFYTTFADFHQALLNDEKIAAMAPGVLEVRRIYALLQGEGVKVAIVIRSGTVSDELVNACSGEGKRPPADLLVIGAHAPNVYAGTDYLENLAEEIAESAPCPTLVVHAKSAWTEWKIVEQDSNQ
jgi:nucleotide-binding universal stress UspA family protein